MSRRAAVLAVLGAVSAAAVAAAVSLSGGGDRDAWGSPVRAPVPTARAAAAVATVDPAGRVHVAWAERRAGRSTLLVASRPPGGPWSAPRAIERDAPFRLSPAAIAGSAAGGVAVLWTAEGDRRSVLMGSVGGPEGDWTPPRALSTVGSAMRRPQAGTDDRGRVTVVGRGLAGPGLWALRYEAGRGWRPPARVSPAGATVDAPGLAVAPGGRAAIVGLAKRQGQPRTLFWTVAGPSGEWSRPRAVPEAVGPRYPAVAIPDGGAPVVAWLEERAGRQGVRAAVLGGTAGEPLDAEPADARPVLGPLLVSDDSGAVVAWARWDSAPAERRASIRALRFAGGAPTSSERVVAATFPPVSAPPGTTVLYGPPPFTMVAGGPAPALLWVQPAGTSSRPASQAWIAARGADGGWQASALPTPDGRVAGLPLAVGGPPGRTVAVWSEGPPGGASDAIVLAEQRG